MKANISKEVQELNKTIKLTMAKVPKGEHLHVAAILFSQNRLIMKLKRRNKAGNPCKNCERIANMTCICPLAQKFWLEKRKVNPLIALSKTC
jgi:hypothetical protein